MNDTIAAISTALGIGAISIIRTSGKEAIEIVNKIFKGKDLTKVDSHTIHYGFIIDKDEIIDEVLVSVMKAPKTFTVEDVVEINCHGGIATTNKVLELLLRNGCRMAEPGEFTKRAFLNGRINLMEAESVMDLINGKTDKARKLAINGLRGLTSNLISNLRKEILELIASIEVNIDYPEYKDIEEKTLEDVKTSMDSIQEKLTKIVKDSENGKLIKEGIKTVILGKPNVGKSSILNRLLDEEKAIVTDIEGTTRDIVEGQININGILLDIIDTAGIRKTKDIIEQKGVEKSLELIDQANLIIMVLNNNEKLTLEDKELLEKTKNKKRILVVNKQDLETKIDLDKELEQESIKIDTIHQEGILPLINKIKELFNMEELENSDLNYISNARQISLLKQALEIIPSIYQGLKDHLPIDMIEIDIKEIYNLLGEVNGESYSDEIIDQLFSQFCLGK